MLSSATPRKEGLIKNRENSACAQCFVARIDIVAFLERNICHCNRNSFRQRRKTGSAAAFFVRTGCLLFIRGLSLITISSVITQWYHSFAGLFCRRFFCVWSFYSLHFHTIHSVILCYAYVALIMKLRKYQLKNIKFLLTNDKSNDIMRSNGK